MLGSRSNEQELIDLGPAHYTKEEYNDCLFQLDRIGRFLGGDKATFKAFNQLSSLPSSILDVGCGGGLFTMRLAQKYTLAAVTGIDLSREAIAFAQEQLKKCAVSNVEFIVSDTPELVYPPNSFDVVTATLVCHHLSDPILPFFLKDACRIASQAVILNDLHRHPLASLGFASVVPFLFRNRLIWHDGLLSIRRSFTRRDWVNLLKTANIDEKNYTLTWNWAFRWIVKIDTSKMRKG